jgi:hypothetical protein
LTKIPKNPSKYCGFSPECPDAHLQRLNKLSSIRGLIMKYMVYELWNPIKNQPFYVGYAKRAARPADHIKEAFIQDSEKRKGSNPHKIYTIREIYLKKHGS